MGLKSPAPVTHRLAHRLTNWGLRGDRFVWAVAKWAQPVPQFVPLEVAPGLCISLATRDLVARELYRGHYERFEIRLVRDLVRKGGVCIDVGAHLGLYTLLFASLVGQEGRVIAFEPAPFAFERLASGTVALPQVEAKRVALGAVEGVKALHLTHFSDFVSTFRTKHVPWSTFDVEVPVERLDGFIDGIGEIDFLKLDTEGWEADVLRGAPELFPSGRVRAALIEITPAFGTVEFLVSYFETSPYSLFRVSSRSRGIRRYVDLQMLTPHDLFELGAGEQFNLLMIRDDLRHLVL